MNSIKQHWFLAGLMLVLGLGAAFPRFFEPFANARPICNAIVASVLFVMALPVDAKSIGNSIRNPWASLLGSVVNMGLVPILAWGLSRFLDGEMRTGLLVTAAVPCTLASAAVWTRRAGGDDTVAIFVTLLTNITCFLTTPFWLTITTGAEVNSQLQHSLAGMPKRLALLVVLPMVAAQIVRRQPDIARWSTTRKTWLSTYAQVGILSIVLAGATECGLRITGRGWEAFEGFPRMLMVVLMLHLFVLGLGMFIARILGFRRPQQIAVGIAGSQKTLMIGLDIAINYFGGLAILPMVTYHFVQLIVDTVAADWLRRHDSAHPEDGVRVPAR